MSIRYSLKFVSHEKQSQEVRKIEFVVQTRKQSAASIYVLLIRQAFHLDVRFLSQIEFGEFHPAFRTPEDKLYQPCTERARGRTYLKSLAPLKNWNNDVSVRQNAYL